MGGGRGKERGRERGRVRSGVLLLTDAFFFSNLGQNLNHFGFVVCLPRFRSNRENEFANFLRTRHRSIEPGILLDGLDRSTFGWFELEDTFQKSFGA